MFNLLKKGSRGFTLIELLVVIAIIGILSSVVLASLNSARERSRDARRMSDIDQIRLALEMYNDQNNGDYPEDLEDLVPDFLPRVVTDPQGNNYTYASPSGSYAYCLSIPMEGDNHTSPSGCATGSNVYAVSP